MEDSWYIESMEVMRCAEGYPTDDGKFFPPIGIEDRSHR